MDRAGWEQVAQEERERQLYEALDECYRKGVSKDSLLTLCFEAGARWTPDDARTVGMDR